VIDHQQEAGGQATTDGKDSGAQAGGSKWRRIIGLDEVMGWKRWWPDGFIKMRY